MAPHPCLRLRLPVYYVHFGTFVVLVCIFMMTNNVEYFIICSLVICIFFCEVYADISGFLSGPSDKEPAYQCRRHKRSGFDPWVRTIPWRRVCQPTPVFLHGESHGQKSLAGYSPWGHKELDTTEVT